MISQSTLVLLSAVCCMSEFLSMAMSGKLVAFWVLIEILWLHRMTHSIGHVLHFLEQD
jgi:hypothetical protein